MILYHGSVVPVEEPRILAGFRLLDFGQGFYTTRSYEQADIDIGPVADDNVYASIRLFETNVLDEDETIKRLKTETLHDQITFHMDAALAFCKLIEVREIREAT